MTALGAQRLPPAHFGSCKTFQHIVKKRALLAKRFSSFMYLFIFTPESYSLSYKSKTLLFFLGKVVVLICFSLSGVMGEYEPKIEVQFPEFVHITKGSTVKLECFALGK